MIRISLFLSLLVLAIYASPSFAQQGSETRLDTSAIRIQLESIGLEFTSEEIQQMVRGTSNNIASYQAIRNFQMSNAVSPSLLFNHLPIGFVVPPADIKMAWNLHPKLRRPKSDVDIAFMSITELASLIQSRQITSTELTHIYLNRLKKFNDSLLCVVTLTEELALKLAAKADEEIAKGIYRGPLHGIPYGVKDLLSVPGYPTTWGALPYKNQVLPETATVVRKLTDAGAVLVAKLTLGALAMGDVWFGGTTKNPWDTKQGSSGSSAGPASATSAGLVAFSVGSETLGSIVSPSTRCGVTGLRPTFGQVSKYGAMALSWSMDKLGPICRSAKDCAIVLDAIRGYDPLDPSTVKAGFNYPYSLNIKQLKIAYLRSEFDKDRGFKVNNETAFKIFKELGAELIPIELPSQYPVNALRIILNAEAGAAFNELTLSNRDSLLVSQGSWSWPNSFRTSRLIPAVEYILANRIRRLLIEETHLLLKDYDIVICPSFGGDQLTLTNLTGHPALLIPSGLDDKGHPTSITLIANYFDDGKLCAVGQLFQNKAGIHKQRPPHFNID